MTWGDRAQPIRRFDVFADYNKVRASREGRPLVAGWLADASDGVVVLHRAR
jgi:hypothetical protein